MTTNRLLKRRQKSGHGKLEVVLNLVRQSFVIFSFGSSSKRSELYHINQSSNSKTKEDRDEDACPVIIGP